jgi:hypothetical protein
MEIYIWQLDVVQQVSNHVALEDAKDYCFEHGRGRVLLGICGRS